MTRRARIAKAVPTAATPAPPRQGGSTLSRWPLTVDQRSAVDSFVWAKGILASEPGATADYGPNAEIKGTGYEIEKRVDQRREANRIIAVVTRVLERNLLHYQSLFLAIVLDGCSAADAGRNLAESEKGAQFTARAHVMMLADQIALEFQRDGEGARYADRR